MATLDQDDLDAIVAALLDATLSGHATAGTVGKALSDAAAAPTLTITPIQANAANPRYSTRDLPPIAAGSAPTDVFEIVDGTGAAVDLAGKSLRLVAFSRDGSDDSESVYDDELTPAFKYETGSGLIVGGTNNNQVTLQHSAANTAAAGEYEYFLWNTTDNLVLMKGRLPIEPSLSDI